MDKIWIIHNKRSYARKFNVYKDEANMLKNLKNTPNSEVLEYELKSSSNASEYLKSRERDTQLRSILGELSSYESNALKLIQLYESLASIPVHKASHDDHKKEKILRLLKSSLSNKKSFSNVLSSYKADFFKISDSVEWITAILRCHNFRDYKCSIYEYDYKSHQYKNKFIESDELKKNFNLAKMSLMKKKIDERY